METATTEGRTLIHALEPERVAAPSAATRIASALPGIAAAGVIAALGFADGGYFATAWGPLTLVFLSFAVIALLVRPQQSFGLRTLALPALLGLLAIWTLVSVDLGIAERSGAGGGAHAGVPVRGTCTGSRAPAGRDQLGC